MSSKSLKIGLIDTGDKSFSNMPHIGLAYLAAFLKRHGHTVRILDLYFSTHEEQTAFFKKDLDLIGLTATSYSFVTCLAAIKRIKAINPKPKIVVGGPHASVARSELLEHHEIDFGIYGEGEKPLLALADLLAETSSPTLKELAAIPSLIYRQDGRPIVNKPARRIKELDDLPFPAYEGFPLEAYSCYPLSTSRGCPYGCIYCASSAVMGTQWIARSPENIVAEIKAAIQKYGKQEFYIIDDSFNLNEQRVKEFCRLLLAEELGISWGTCGFRADRSDPEMLALMKRSGCKGVCVGIESANPKVLENIGKGETIEQIRQGIERIHEAGLHITGMFMIGNPGDTLESVRQSFAFAKSLPLDTVRFYLAIPYPETGLWDFVQKNGRFLAEDYKNFHDFSDRPVFETNDFTAEERSMAYQEALQIMFPKEVPEHVVRVKDIELAGEDEPFSKIRTRYAPQ